MQDKTNDSENSISIEDQKLVRLPEVLKMVNVSRSHWLDGCKNGIFPAPVKIGKRAIAWRTREIENFISNLPTAYKY